MSMIMNHNITSLMGHRIMQKNTLAMKRSLEKLSTGMRTKVADLDNVAGLAISETMRSRIFGMDKALYNSQDGISLIQTANGALEQTQSMLQRMRELSVQAANDVLTQQDRSYIQVEINEIRDHISLIASTTQFNRKKILSGDNAVLWSSTDSQVKAVIKGGLRSVDQFGQKYAVDGNFKIRVTAEAGKAETQKTDVFKVKHDDVVTDKTLQKSYGVKDVSVEGSLPSGNYTIGHDGDVSYATEGVFMGSIGLGGRQDSIDSTISFKDVSSSVTKVSVVTSDGVEIWSTSGSNIFGSYEATAEEQAAFFAGGTTDTGKTYSGVKDEIIANARRKGITLEGFPDSANGDTSLTLTAKTTGTGDAPVLYIKYEGGGIGIAPTTTTGSKTTENLAASDVFSLNVESTNTENASVLFEVTHVDGANGTVTLKASASKLSQEGLNTVAYQDNIVLSASEDASTVGLYKLFGGTSGTANASLTLNDLSGVTEGAKFVYFVGAGGASENNQNETDINISGLSDSSDPHSWNGGPMNGETIHYVLDGSKTADTEIKFTNYFVNGKSGEVTQGSVILETGSLFRSDSLTGGKLGNEDITLANFNASYVGKVADGNTKLRDLDKFWTADGTFILEQPKELTLTQGDGTQAKVMLYAGDTLDDAARKLNHAIANGLGQAKYVDDATKFVTFVDADTKTAESVEGTMVIRSALAGEKGRITLSGSEDVLKAFSLNTIQEAEENKYNVSIVDAHDGSEVASNVKITGNRLVGVIHKNVDIELDPMMGVNAAWNDEANNFVYSTSGTSETILHLADNTTVFQMGASEGDDVLLNIGDMGSHSLGLDGVNVMSRERAATSISLIDAAIDRVSMQQASLGAAQNRLEHHINNLTKEMESLTEANSHIRDTDYQKEVLEYAKMQILMQANTAMLAQSNAMQRDSIGGVLRQ